MNNINELTNYIQKSNNIVVFSGAGISVASGINSFRGNNGLYITDNFEGMSPENILCRQTLKKNPRLVLRFYKHRLLSIADKQPNKAHLALKKLQDIGKLKAIVTQNIDDLHNKAGNTNVYELHGNIKQYKCNGGMCPRTYNHEEFLSKLDKEEVPKCDCGFSIIRPNVVLFDEWLNENVFDNALREIQKADLLIAIGSSLVVMPACSLVNETSPYCKKVLINNQPTQFDKKFDLVINEDCGDVLDTAVNNLT